MDDTNIDKPKVAEGVNGEPVGYKNPPMDCKFKPGESGNPAGRPEGRKNLATIIRDLMEDPDFDWKNVPIKDKDKAMKIGSPWKAIVHTAMAQAYSGNKDAREWLRKAGYGDKIDVTSEGKKIQAPLIISTIAPRYVEPEEQAAESS